MTAAIQLHASEARELDKHIDRAIHEAGSRLDQARGFLLQMRDGRGWEHLTNPATKRPWASFMDYAVAKFERSPGHIRRHLRAAALDVPGVPGGAMAIIPERQLRSLGALPEESRNAVSRQLFSSGNRPSVSQINATVLSRMSQDEQAAFVRAAEERSKRASDKVDNAAELTHFERALEGYPGVVRHLESAAAGAKRAGRHVNKVSQASRNVKRWARLICEEIQGCLAACEGRRTA